MTTLDPAAAAPATVTAESLLRQRDPCKDAFIFRDAAPHNKKVPHFAARGLLAILSWKRPFDSDGEELFARHYLDPIAGMTQDGFRNRHITIPYANGTACNVIWSCHIDTCHHDEGYQRLSICKDNAGIQYVRTRRGEGNCLGADDGTGAWIMLEMIRAKRPGRYIFHRGEERGCLGSKWILDKAPQYLQDATAAIAFDRKDFTNIITHQGGERGCSEAFATSIGEQLTNYKADPSGLFTDTKQYFRKIPECTNLSVGYQSQHGPLERQYLDFAVALRDRMLTFDASRLVIERDPTKYERVTYNYGHNSRGANNELWENHNNNNYRAKNNIHTTGSDPANKDPAHWIHNASNANKETYVWSKHHGKNILRIEAVFVTGEGFVLKESLIGKEFIAKNTSTSTPRTQTSVIPDDSLDADNELFDIQLEIDLERTLGQLVFAYPTAAEKLLEAAGIDKDDFLQMVYSDYMETADDEDADDSKQGGGEGASAAQQRHEAATKGLVAGAPADDDAITEGEAIARAFAEHDAMESPNKKEKIAK